MQRDNCRRIVSIALVLLSLAVLVGVNLRLRPPPAKTVDAAWISLSIRNGKAGAPLDLAAGQDYVFQRLTLAVDNRNVADGDALNWLRDQSDFSALDWSGVRDTRAYWQNFSASRPDADLYSHVFEGAKWMDEDNSFELSVLDTNGKAIGQPLRLTNADFLNRQTQHDFDLIKAEYRYEHFTRSKDLDSAKSRRAVAKIVFAVQTDLAKRLTIPANAHALRIVWDKKPQAPYIVPINLVPGNYGYGGKLHVDIEPKKPVYLPGDVIRATFTLIDQNGQPLKFSEADKNGIRQINIHLDGPVQNPTYYHEEWLSEFGKRNAHHFRSPALGLGAANQSANINLDGPPLSADGSSMVVELHVQKNLPMDHFGTFEIGATVWRKYASEDWTDRLDTHIQVGQDAHTHFETFGCINCHVPDTAMDVGSLIPPMVGLEKLKVDSIESCVLCHDNSRNGSRRLNRYLHLIHMNQEKFPTGGNTCGLCHLGNDSIRKGEYP